jgi:hypothetical protein
MTAVAETAAEAAKIVRDASSRLNPPACVTPATTPAKPTIIPK